MESSTYSYYMIVIGILAIGVELLLGFSVGLHLLFAGVCLVLGGTIGMLAKSFIIAAVASAVLGAIYVEYGSPYLKRTLVDSSEKATYRNIVGEKAEVIKAVGVTTPGYVDVSGLIWRAKSLKTAKKPLPKGTKVVVKRVLKNMVVVEPVS